MTVHIFYRGTAKELIESVKGLVAQTKDILPVDKRESYTQYWLIIYPDCADNPAGIGVAYLRKTWNKTINHSEQKTKEETGEVWVRNGIKVVSHHAHNQKCRIRMNLCAVIEVEPWRRPVFANKPHKLPNQNGICDEERTRIDYESNLHPCNILQRVRTRERRGNKTEALQAHINPAAGQSMKRMRGAGIGV